MVQKGQLNEVAEPNRDGAIELIHEEVSAKENAMNRGNSSTISNSKRTFREMESTNSASKIRSLVTVLS